MIDGRALRLDRGDVARHLSIMTIHVPIGEAKTRLPELVAAAMRGEDVVLDTAGTPQVRLVKVAQDAVDRRATARRSAIGMFAERAAGRDIDVGALKADDQGEDGRRQKFVDPD